MSYLKRLRRVDWRRFRFSYWLRRRRLRVRVAEDFWENPGEGGRERPAGLPPPPVVDSLNGAFFSGSRWQRPP